MAVKKSTKKAAKKTYTPAKKTTIPKLKNKLEKTVEELAAVMAENHAKTEASIRKLSAENAKSREETDAAIGSLIEQGKKTDAAIESLTKSLDDSFGGISRRLGKLTELIVVPKLRLDMNAQGHNFDHAEVNKRIRGVIGGRKEDIAEVDMLLLGSAEAMAVEIKTRLKDNHVKDHIERLQDLRDHEEEAGVQGKKLFGAMVGIAVDDKARKLAKNNGLYIVEIREEEGKLNIEKPVTCRPW
jgi:hypothetical protein